MLSRHPATPRSGRARDRFGALVLLLTLAACTDGAPAAPRDAAEPPGADAADADTAPPGPSDAGSETDATRAGDAASDAPGPLSDPIDLVLFARLRPSATLATAPFGLVREDTDAVATLRDDQPETSWKVPPDTTVTLEIDWQPLLAAPLALRELRWRYTGDAPRDVTVALLPACGEPAQKTVPWPPATPDLALGDEPAGCVRLQFTTGTAFALDALQLHTHDPAAAALHEPLPASVPVSPTGVAAQSGVIEGFYGVPWSFRERRQLLAALAASGLGSYLYAPKNDPLHRELWREPYPADMLDSFAALAAAAEARNVTFFVGLSPFIDYDGEAPADRAALDAKLTAFLDRGIRGLALLADDIEFETDVTVDGALAARQVALVNELFAAFSARYPGLRLQFVPTVYSDQRRLSWPGGQAYLEGLRGLDPAIAILWTGTDVFCDTLAAGDLDAFRAATGRAPLLWDNFWANDAGDALFGRLLLAPWSGRGPDLPPAVVGIGQNLGIQGALSRLTLATFGAWLREPAAYEPAEAGAQAAAAEAAFCYGPTRPTGVEPALLRRIPQLFAAHGTGTPADAAFDGAVDALTAALDAAPDAIPLAEVQALLAVAAPLTVLPAEVDQSRLDPDLVDELAFPLAKVQAEAEVALWSLALLAERLRGLPGDAAAAAADAARARAQASRFVFGSGRPQRLLQAVRGVPASDRGLRRPAAETPPPTDCTAGTPLVWQPFGADAGEVAVFGLAAAAFEPAGTLRWTPPHAGRFVGLATALTAGPAPGWQFHPFTLVCRPPPG